MSGGLLGTAVSGLMAFQRSIETTSQNIANANTEGYSRQRTELQTTLPQYTGSGYVGSGVKVSNITRSYDQFISTQLRSSTTAFNEVSAFKDLATQVDNLLADPSTGVNPAIQSFFNSVNDVANDPSSIAAREVMISEGNNLTHRFGVVSNRLGELRNQVNSDLKSMTETANSYTTTIADLNKSISTDLGRTGGLQQPNDLLDERDLLLKKLSELVDISVIPQTNGMVSVVMSNGQPLVMDAQASQLGTQANKLDPTQLDITLSSATGGVQVITNQINGGKIAGTLRFKNEIVDPSQQKLGAVAAGIAMEFNGLHQVVNDSAGNPISGGYDLDGNSGLAFFKFNGVSEVPATAVTGNTGNATVTAAFNDIRTNPTGANSSDLNTSDYLLKYEDPVNSGYTLTRINDNSVIPLTITAGVLTPTNAADKLPGITLSINATPNAGDQFFIRPTYQAATNLAMNITDPRKIAAATNKDGNGALIVGAMPGDNRNALSLAGLANNTGLFGGTASYQEAYGQIVSKVGGATHTANVSATAQQNLLTNATTTQQNLAGVNLDEEAANLIKFQQSYQAAAKSISTASSLFNSILAAVG